MKAPVEWLKEYVPIRLTPEALAKRLTMAGLEVVDIAESVGGPVFDLEITPNRADGLSIIGIAREIAVLTGQRLKLPQRPGNPQSAIRNPKSVAPRIVIRIEDRKGCPRYIGRLIAGVRAAPSPDWMQRRLLACGARPINTLVDITNYVLLESGQPLHAFDFDRLTDGTILVRRAHPSEPITTLDGIKRSLAPEHLVIADATQPVALAGVMGGIGSEVTEATRTVLLESALFDPVTVRRTARALGVASESSYRFERGVDPEGVEAASTRAAGLVLSLAGGALHAVKDVGRSLSTRTTIVLETQWLAKRLGVRVASMSARSLLAQLSCRVAASGEGTTLRVIAPSFRRDLTQPVDLSEEIARLIGYDKIPPTLPSAPLAVPGAASVGGYADTRALRRLCMSLGLTETIHWTLVSEAELTRCGLTAADALRLANPLSQDHAFLRPTLLIGLLRMVRHNLAQGAASARAFELGRVMSPGLAGQPPLEAPRLGIVLCGDWTRDWRGTQACDFFRLKGLVEAVVRQACVRQAAVEPGVDEMGAWNWAEPGQAAQVLVDGRAIGSCGQIGRTVAAGWDVPREVWMAELAVGSLLASRRAKRTITPLAVFPPVKRDLSIVVSMQVSFAAVEEAIGQAATPLADRVELVDRYAGSQIPSGTHSLTFAIDYRDPSKTLTSQDVDAVHQRVTQALTDRFGARRR